MGIIIGVSILLIGGVAVLLGKPEGSTQTSGSIAGISGPVVVSERAGDWVRGNKDAAVTIFEFSDFQCPACAAYAPIVKKVVDEYQGKVKEVYRYFPLTSIHPNSIPAAKAAEAAGRQGKFWEMADVLFTKQQDWAGSNGAAGIFEGYAKDLSLNVDKFKQDVKDPETEKRINVDANEASKLNLQGTPSFYINGKYVDIPGSYTNFKALIDSELKTVSVSPTPAVATSTPQAK